MQEGVLLGSRVQGSQGTCVLRHSTSNVVGSFEEVNYPGQTTVQESWATLSLPEQWEDLPSTEMENHPP